MRYKGVKLRSKKTEKSENMGSRGVKLWLVRLNSHKLWGTKG